MEKNPKNSRRERLEKIFFHLGKGVWKGIPVIGPIVEEMVYEANKDVLLGALAERTENLSEEDLRRLEEALLEVEEKIASVVGGIRDDIRADLMGLEERLQQPVLSQVVASVRSVVANLGLALSDYYSAALTLRLRLLDYTEENPQIQSYLTAPLPPGLQKVTDATAEAIDALANALAEAQRNDIVSSCWRRARINLASGALESIRANLVKHGFSPDEAIVDPADMAGLRQFLNVASAKLREHSFQTPLSAVVATNSSNAVGQSYDNAALRSLVFSGNLLFGFMQPSKADPDALLVVSFGTAMLLDMVGCLPTSEIIREELHSRFPEHAHLIEDIPLRFDHEAILSSDFRFAINKLEDHRSLIFLAVPMGRSPGA